MEIYNKEPVMALYDIVKDLVDEIPIYKEVMTEDEKNIPQSYILLRSEVTNFGNVYGDGKSVVRGTDNDIILTTKGYAESSTDLHNINKKKISDLLKEKGIDYSGVNIGYVDALNSTQYTFTVEVNYLG